MNIQILLRIIEESLKNNDKKNNDKMQLLTNAK